MAEPAAHRHRGELLGGVVGAADEVDALGFGGLVDRDGVVHGRGRHAEHEGVDVQVGEPVVGIGAPRGTGHDREAAVHQLAVTVEVELAAVADGRLEAVLEVVDIAVGAVAERADVDAVLRIPGAVGLAGHGLREAGPGGVRPGHIHRDVVGEEAYAALFQLLERAPGDLAVAGLEAGHRGLRVVREEQHVSLAAGEDVLEDLGAGEGRCVDLGDLLRVVLLQALLGEDVRAELGLEELLEPRVEEVSVDGASVEHGIPPLVIALLNLFNYIP